METVTRLTPNHTPAAKLTAAVLSNCGLLTEANILFWPCLLKLKLLGALRVPYAPDVALMTGE